MAIYRNNTLPEKSRKVSVVRGFSYRYREITNRLDILIDRRSQSYREQYLSLIPTGFDFHTDHGLIRPFASLGLGLAIILESYYGFGNTADPVRKTAVTFFPAVNVAVGAKLKVGSKFILAAVTRCSDGYFMNIGYSF
jgi:hypothetical protein